MPTAKVETPVFDVLTVVLGTTSPNGVAEGEVNPGKSTAVFSYRKCKHFNALWKMVESLPSWLENADEKERTIVLTWDGMPDSPGSTINVADYVTPFDWAFALSWALIESKTDHEDRFSEDALPGLRILILDLKSQEHFNSLGVRTFTVAGRALPWVHTYRPLESERLAMAVLPDDASDDPDNLAALRSALPVGSFGINHMIIDLLAPNRLQKLGDLRGTSSREDIEMLVDLWRSNLTRAGDRHHVGNLLAPLLLAEGLPQPLKGNALEQIEEDHPLRSALRKLADVLELAGSKSGGDSLDHTNPEIRINHEIGGGNGLLAALAEEPDPFGRKQNVRVGLVDDQYELGFHHVLVQLLLGDQHRPAHNGRWRTKRSSNADGIGGELWCKADASGLFETLRSQSEVEDWGFPHYLDLDCDVLLLDLRLWTRKKEREAFFEELLSVCETLGTEDLQDQDLSFKRAFEAAGKLVPSGDEDKEDKESNELEASEVEALALLPLLLSHYDPSLPIVLFSSTQQRVVVEMTAHRPNILTGFSKPILSGYGKERAASDSLSDLVKEVRRAVRLHEVRRLWERIGELEWAQELPKFSTYNPDPPEWGQYKYIMYNTPGGKTAHPNVQGEALRSQMATLYTRYLVGNRPYDFASRPWEFLEGALTPSELLTRDDVNNPGLSIYDQFDKRNWLSRVVSIARNKKAHGHAKPPVNGNEQYDWNLASLLLFSCLLDFIVAESAHANDERDVQSIRDQLHHRLLPDYTDLDPKYLTARDDVEWLPFVAYTTLWAILKSKDAGCYRASNETRNAAKVLGDHVIT